MHPLIIYGDKMDLERLEKIDKLKTKMLKYIFYKKRTEKEIWEKFKNEDNDILEETIENLKEIGYINDVEYIEKFIHEAVALKNLSIFELKYKLYSKGISDNLIEDYILENSEILEEYELLSARNIIEKKRNTQEFDDTIIYLKKKRYMTDTISKIKNEEEQ